MSGPYCQLVEEIDGLEPRLDPDGFFETLDQIDARLLEIDVRPRKQELRMALHALYRSKANVRLAELECAARF